MKAVIALSGLAGVVLFGPPLVRALSHDHHHVTVTVHDVSHEVSHAVSHAVHSGDQSQCRYEAERSFQVGVGSGVDLQLFAGSGDLEVVGVEGLSEVRAVARACASHEEYLEELQLSHEESGSTLTVETLYPEFSGRWNGGQRYARLDLRLEVPWGMDAKIEDGSGEASLWDLGTLDIRDGSGELAIGNIMGALSVEDGSGEIQIQGVEGSVTIEDGSGEIALRSVGGDVEIDDGSGEIDIANVMGSVFLTDSSGEIDVQDVAVDVTVRRDSSGSIEVSDVGGDFTVHRDGGGGIRHSNVAGTVDIPKRRGDR